MSLSQLQTTAEMVDPVARVKAALESKRRRNSLALAEQTLKIKQKVKLAQNQIKIAMCTI